MENKTPTLEEVKEYFKNAKEVREIGYDKIFFINWENVYLSEYENWCLEDGKTIRYIWNEKKGYAEIISYKEEIKTPNHYDNSKGSIYQFCENQNLNSYEFDIIKRVVRSRKKGNFKEDLEKTKHLIDLYLSEYGK